MSDIIELRKKRRKLRKKKSVLPFLLFIVLLLALFLLLITQVFTIKEIIIEGNQIYSEEEILGILELDEKTSILELYMKTKSGFESLIYIDDVEIEYISYEKVKINISEKQIVGYIYFMSMYHSIDKDGYVVDSVTKEQMDPDIAVIEGLNTDSFVLGERLNISRDIIDLCLLFHRLEQKHNIHIDTIEFKKQSKNDIRLKIGNLTVEFGNSQNVEKKMLDMIEMIRHIPTDERGTLYLGQDGIQGHYEKNIE